MSEVQSECREFRESLSRALEGRPQPEQLIQLSWHEHLLGCLSCRGLLEDEEALEALLATLPDPKLPPDLSRRVIRRLGSPLVPSLDAVLDLDSAVVPSGLAGRVLGAVARERALDALLDRDHVEVPAGLARSVLGGLQAELAPRPRSLRAPVLLAAAAALLVWVILPKAPLDDGEEEPEVARLDALVAPDPELLAAFEVLERDELWDEQGGVAPAPADLELLLSESVDVEDELLLAFLADETESSDR